VSVADARVEPVNGVEPRAIGPAWSPDGRWIAYVGESGAARWDLFVVPAGGGTPMRLTQDASARALEATWTADGRSIIYSSDRGGALNLWRVWFDPRRPSAAGAPERLTAGIGDDLHAAAAPAGDRIAYARVPTAPDVWQMDVATGALRRLTSEPAAEDHPRISPDGASLCVQGRDGGAPELYRIAADGGDVSLIPTPPGDPAHPAWSRDGRVISSTSSTSSDGGASGRWTSTRASRPG